MKKTLLFGFLLGLYSLAPASTTEYVCYETTEAQSNDFWVEHMYYAKCTDYVGTGSKSFETSDYVDFNGGSTIDFTNIHVSKDGIYTVQLYYGIGWADNDGAGVKVNVNGELAKELVLYKLAGNPPAIEEFDVELYADYDNVIQLKQVKDWAITLGIKLVPQGATSLDKVSDNPYFVTAGNDLIKVQGLNGANNQIQVYGMDGKLVYSNLTEVSSLDIPATKGAYIVKVNGYATKVLVK